MTIQRIETGARMSKVVIHGDTVYLAGFTANKALTQGVVEQTEEILSIIDGYLAKAGTDKTKLLRHHLALRHPHRGRHEPGVGCLGAGRLRARARLHRGAATGAGEEGRDPGHGRAVKCHSGFAVARRAGMTQTDNPFREDNTCRSHHAAAF